MNLVFNINESSQLENAIDKKEWFRKRSWAEVNLDNLENNMQIVRKMIGNDCKIMGVVKSDAYGHGDEIIAPELERLGADWLGVSEIEEGLVLRRCGITKPILNFTGIPVEYASIAVEADITTILPGFEYAVKLNEHCAQNSIIMKAHFSIDTGIGRLGFQTSDDKFDKTIEQIKEVMSFKNLDITGMYTHYAYVGNPKKEALEYTELQYNRFNRVLDALKLAGINIPLVHTCNSAATFTDKNFHFDLVREGINLYDGPQELGFKPVMSLKSKVTHLKEIAVGEKVSYNCIFTAERPTKVATVSLGYGDGYHRHMSGKAKAIVSGVKVPVIGSICMDQMMLDVTDVPAVEVGDTVTIVGRDHDNEITWTDLAGWADTINYEMTCGITRRIPRIYMRDGKDVEYIAYQHYEQQNYVGSMHKNIF